VKCIVGLGNPGPRYERTRHNVGFLLTGSQITAHAAVPLLHTDLYESYRCTAEDQELALLMPMTYMNASGEAVRDFMERYGIAVSDTLIVYDDFQIPFGTLRLRPHGSDGGHNGLASIIECLQTNDVPRLRIGVGGVTMPAAHTHESMADYVLSRFGPDEEKLLPQLLTHARAACSVWAASGIGIAMNRYNRNFFSSASAE
jgi:PTH1 family peptidyl-tRNA hydrolase